MLNCNLHSFQLIEIIQVLDSISWVRCASGNVIFLICCSSISPTVVVLASMRCILAFCCAGLRPIVWQLQLPAWLSKQCHLNVSSTYSPSPQCLLNLFSVFGLRHQSVFSAGQQSSFSCQRPSFLFVLLSVNSCRSLCCFFPGQEQLVAGLAQCPRSLPANCRLLHIISPQVALPPCYT